MIAPYDYEAMWAKAKVFLNRAMDEGVARSFDEQALWASAALELLAKAALAKVTPLLIAEPSEDGKNVMIALGMIEGEARFTSVPAKTVFMRCARAFHPFNSDEALKIAYARNEYLHGPQLAFLALPPQVWWPRFWALASILVDAQDKTMDELVGSDRVTTVDAHLQQNKENIKHRIESLIARARQRLSQHEAGTMSARQEQEWRATADVAAGMTYNQIEACPACGEDGVLEGDDDSDYEDEYDDEESFYLVTRTAHVPVEYFGCPNCHLVLDVFELIREAGLPEVFDVDIEVDYPEEEYGND